MENYLKYFPRLLNSNWQDIKLAIQNNAFNNEIDTIINDNNQFENYKDDKGLLLFVGSLDINEWNEVTKNRLLELNKKEFTHFIHLFGIAEVWCQEEKPFYFEDHFNIIEDERLREQIKKKFDDHYPGLPSNPPAPNAEEFFNQG